MKQRVRIEMTQGQAKSLLTLLAGATLAIDNKEYCFEETCEKKDSMNGTVIAGKVMEELNRIERSEKMTENLKRIQAWAKGIA